MVVFMFFVVGWGFVFVVVFYVVLFVIDVFVIFVMFCCG